MMFDELYTISIFLTIGVLFTLALCFLFVSYPEKPALGNYRIARYAMAYAYLFFAAINIVEYYSRSAEMDAPLVRMLTLVISCSQSVLFTLTFITLVDIRFVTRRRIVGELLPVTGLIATMFIVYFVWFETFSRAFFYLFIVFYICLLVRYTNMFRANYRNCLARMDNFFAGMESRRLHWISFSFYASLTVGVTALLSAMFMSHLGSLLFAVAVIVFYIYIAVRFINYALSFNTIETAIVRETTEIATRETAEPNTDDRTMMKKIEQLITEKQLYRKTDISIDEVALALGVKHHIVSMTISHCRKINFKTFINEYRVKEAMLLLSDSKKKNLSIEGIACEAGFTDRYNFYRIFKKHTGHSPVDFRKNQR
jgi:AraC-like DNA-binding protein